MEQTKRGKLIALYGINRLGKTTQAKLLVDRLEKEKRVSVEYVKYPLYDLIPTGPRINAYLREGNPDGLAPREFQLLHILNRTQHDHDLRAKLAEGKWIVAEDYWGTGVAWGMAAGVGRDYLIDLNGHLVREDLAVLLDGKPFVQATERGHLHEENNSLSLRARQAHVELHKIFRWSVVKANHPIEDVRSSVWSVVTKILAVP